MRRLIDWTGDVGGVTIGSVYQLDPKDPKSFLDDFGYERECEFGAWEDVDDGEDGTSEEYTGGSSSYYTIHITKPTTPDNPPYVAECNDIIEALGMTFAEGNNFKATWRTAAARQGKKKKGNNAVYDAEKCVFFSDRILVAAKGTKL